MHATEELNRVLWCMHSHAASVVRTHVCEAVVLVPLFVHRHQE